MPSNETPDVNTSPGRLSRGRAMMALGLIVVLAACLRLYLFNGYTGLDDGEYGRLAYLMARGAFPLHDYPGPAAFLVRVGLVAPTALVVRLVGLTEHSMAALPFLCSLASLPVAFALASLLFGRGAGLWAAGILAVTPIDVQNSTTLVPDLPAAFLAAAGVTLIVWLSRWESATKVLLFLGGLGAGLLFGFSWLTKESIAYLAPFILVLMILTVRRRGRAFLILWAGATVGAVGTLFGEMAVYHALTGDALFRFHEVERNYAALQNGFFSEGSDWGWQAGQSHALAVLRRLFVTGPRALLWNEGTSYLPLAGLVGVAYGWFRRDRAFLIPSLWLLILLLMYNFGSSSTSTYTPLALFNRYLFPLFFPAVILMAGLVSRQLGNAAQVARSRRLPIRQWSGFLIVGIVLWSGVRPLGWLVRSSDRHWWTDEVRELASRISPETVLYSDTLTLRGLDFFKRYPGENHWIDFQRIGSAEDIPNGSLVLINPSYLEWLERNRGMWLSRREGYRIHSFFTSPPQEWAPMWENGRSTLFRVGQP